MDFFEEEEEKQPTDFFNNREDIIEWLNRSNIEDYIVSKRKPYLVRANDNVEINGKNLRFVPVKFSKIEGNLDCSNNLLTDLSFCPSEIGGYAYFNKNKLSSLKNFPKKINGIIDLSKNNLTEESLIDLPLNISDVSIINLKENKELNELQNTSIIEIKKHVEWLKKNKEVISFNDNLEKELPKKENWSKTEIIKA